MRNNFATIVFALALTLVFAAPNAGAVYAANWMQVTTSQTGSSLDHGGNQTPLPMSGTLSGLSCCGEGCNPNRGNDFETHRWVGWKWGMTNGSKLGGVYANIWNYSPWIYPVSNNYSASWAMLTYDHPVTQLDVDYAQAGWLEFQGGDRHTFFQTHVKGQSYAVTYFDAPTYAVNTYTYYDTFEDYYPGYISFQVAGVNYEKIANWFYPTEAQVSGETLSFADQMPGGYTSSYDYEDLFNSSYYLLGWNSFLPGAAIFDQSQGGNDMSAYFGHTNPSSGSNLSIWDKACPH